MKIDGRILATQIEQQLKEQIIQHTITPHLAVLLVGNNPNSLSFIKQKQQAAARIGIKLTFFHFQENEVDNALSQLKQLAINPKVHAIIVQRPIPAENPLLFTELTPKTKDVDGFRYDTQFITPVAQAVVEILKEIYFSHIVKMKKPLELFAKGFVSWLTTQTIVLVGRGETAGKPIRMLFEKNAVPLEVVSRKNNNREKVIQQADVVISAVGKKELIQKRFLKAGCILIGVGISSENGHIYGDYLSSSICDVTAYYTSTPGGVGPVNVACLMRNVVLAATSHIPKK